MYDYSTDYVGNQMVKNVTRVQYKIYIYYIIYFTICEVGILNEV